MFAGKLDLLLRRVSMAVRGVLLQRQRLFLRHSRHDSLWRRILSPGGGMTFPGISTPLLSRQKGSAIVLMGLAAAAGAGLGLNGVRMSSAALLWSALTLAVIVGWSTAASP